jgi:NAD dependent epimerase/dehydratase family enzyme
MLFEPCRDDLVDMFMEALTKDSFKGIYNATAPNPVRMSDLCASLGSVLGRPSWLPVPDFAIQASQSMGFFLGEVTEDLCISKIGGQSGDATANQPMVAGVCRR